jgi:hypothetical protein
MRSGNINGREQNVRLPRKSAAEAHVLLLNDDDTRVLLNEGTWTTLPNDGTRMLWKDEGRKLPSFEELRLTLRAKSKLAGGRAAKYKPGRQAGKQASKQVDESQSEHGPPSSAREKP